VLSIISSKRNNEEISMSDELPPPTRMLQIITGLWASQAVGTAARLGVADQLADRPRKASEVANAVDADPQALFRLMRMLASIDVFTMDEQGRFGLTPLGDTLRSGVPGSVKNFAVAETAPGHWLPWGEMYEAIKTGKPRCKPALGMEIWDWYSKNPEEGEYFNRAMGDLSAAVSDAVITIYDFGKFQKVMDVGGGHGILLGAILKANPKMRGILFDLPHVTATAMESLETQGIAQRCEVATGNFFESVPPGADIHVLKQIIHDWSDKECTTILRNCHQALKPDGKLLLVEMVIPPDNSPSMAQAIDLNMLVLLTGRERTESEYRDLLAEGGFKIERVMPTHLPFSIIEASRV
jgi:ubiquinone/menaquinone biosynthesis C-methylase UbiE